MLKLASWNVNSLKVRLDQVLSWFNEHDVDVLALQETKITDENFPRAVFEELGLQVTYSGQKTYNGMAVITRWPIRDVVVDIHAWDDPQRRILAVTVAGIRLLNLYVPNGAAVDSEKYQYKLNWLAAVQQYIQVELKVSSNLAVVGDFNIAPADADVHDPNAWEGSVLVSPAERQAYQSLLALGLHDAFRELYPQEVAYSWWDYRMGGFRRNHGLRIDHVLLNASLLSVCREVQIDKNARGHEHPSDHAPIIVSLDL